MNTDKKEKREVILEYGAEGGSFTIFGIRIGDGWTAPGASITTDGASCAARES